MTDAAHDQAVRAQVTFESKSGLPRDRVVNTFHFWCSVLDEANLGKIRTKLTAFYNTQPGAGLSTVANWISEHVDRNKPVNINCYDLGDPVTHNAQGKVTGTRPLHQASFNLGPSTTAQGPLPNECAIALSYYADHNAKRYRGRIFIGPLDRSCMVTNTDVAEARVSDACMQSIRSAAANLAADATDEGIRWGLFSTTDNVVRYPVVHGWCDNSFDTIRKRGLRPSARWSF